MWQPVWLRRTFLALALALAGCASPAQDVRSLTILHTNDLHARFLPDENQQGGFAHLATAIQREKAKSEATLVLNGGDLVQGTPVSTIFEGVPVYKVANLLGFDVNTLGNHEFDYGWKKIPEFFAAAEFPTVSANVVDESGNLLAKQAYVIREVNGIRVAIIGALTVDLPRLTSKERREPWKALPVAETVQRYARQLRGEADLILMLSHLFDYEEDEVLKNVPEIDAIISGHNHGGQQEVKDVDGRICVKVRAYGRELGRLDLRVDVPAKKIVSYNWQRIPIDARTIPPDQAVATLVEEWEAKVTDVVDVPIGVSKRTFARHELQSLIEQVMRETTNADLAYMNLGGIRDALPQGQLLARHIWNIMPFDNLIVTGKVWGKQIPEEAARGRQIDPEKEYRFVTNNFIAGQWEDLGLEFPETGPPIRDVFIDWIKEKKVIE
jgi:2',3'-cyclic-nucleotide 2'-phosphodiesterase (5'-nucleotidase family)